MLSFGLPSVISKVSVAAIEHLFVSWERYFRIFFLFEEIRQLHIELNKN